MLNPPMDEDQPVTALVIEGLATADELVSELRDGESQVTRTTRWRRVLCSNA